MRPVRITARLASGVAMNGWGIALDGLLASLMWRDHKDADRLAGRPVREPAAADQEPEDLDLPLARCHRADGLWHWMATTAWPDPPTDRVDVRSWTGRVDHRDLEQVAATLPKVVSGRQGRYRTRRMPLIVIPCRRLTWTAVGDVDEIRRLLTAVRTVGKKRSSGEGHVLEWTIEAVGELDEFAAGHLHPDQTLGRPCPEACLDGSLANASAHRGVAGIRPPYLHPLRQHRLCLPAPLT